MIIDALIFTIFKVNNFITLIGAAILANIIITIYNSLYEEEVLYIQSLKDKQNSKN